MEYSKKFQQLVGEFTLGKDTILDYSGINVKFFGFTSESNSSNNAKNGLLNDTVSENQFFQYPVFLPPKNKLNDKAIILLHGLNERSWNKYLTWAEFLCKHTGKAVILFPLAYHINRSPAWWSNPRVLSSFIEIRKKATGNDRSLCFANFALSERISENPDRFYSSGRQSIGDLVTLLSEIYSGKHPLFVKYTEFDFFAYSIGAFLAQILFMVNPRGLLSNSKLFIFCGGSIFKRMFGQSKSIMDKSAYEKLYNFYTSDLYSQTHATDRNDVMLTAFKTMLKADNNQKERIDFFKNLKNRFLCLALKHDKVMPYEGILEAIGEENKNNTELLDFNYVYNHENPFPIFQNNFNKEVDMAFKCVLLRASAFLS